MFDLTGKRALVTGSGQGIGLGIARHLAVQGAHVLVNDFYPDRAESAAGQLGGEGLSVEARAFDVTDLDAVKAALDGEALDIVVNNAGNAGASAMGTSPFREMDPAQWAGPIDVNLHGVMNTTHATLPGMCERGFGRLITISSGAGSIGLPIGVSPYGAAKAAGMSFMRHMAIENARLGVTANSVALGLMEMTEITDEGLVATLAKTVPKGRLGTGKDIGPAIVWLASDEAEWVTGQTIHVNGGGLTT
ncbi:MAG: SDR family NAD(P)-dependent oxidoreductase [Myxococcota bacterium]